MKKYLLTSTCFLLSLFSFSQGNNIANNYIQKGIAQEKLSHYLMAANYFDSAIFNDPTNKDAYIKNAQVNIEMRKTDAAKINLEKAYNLDKTDNAVITQLAQIYFDYRQFAKAIEFAKKSSNNDNAQKIIAMSYYELEDYTNSLPILQNLITKNNKDVPVLYALARTYLEIEDFNKAITFYKSAIQYDNTNNSRWVYELGLIYYTNTDYKNALGCFVKAQDMGYTKTSDFNENIGFAYLYAGDFEKGETILLNQVAITPDNKLLLREIAEVFYARKLYDKSLSYCQKLIEIDKGDAKALYQAGLCFQKKGEKDRGEKLCDQAIVLDPSLQSLRQKKMDLGL